MIPYPFATDDHQTANAAVLADAGAAWLVQQHDLSADMFVRQLQNILGAPDELARRAAAALSLGKPDAALRLADVVEQIARSGAA